MAWMVTAIVVSTVLWANLENRFIWIVLFVTLAFGVIGYVDDYKKLVLQDPAGLSAGKKLFWQSVAAIIASVALYMLAVDPVSTSLLIPYFKDLALPLGVMQIGVTFLFIVGFSNAVNLTDGLDGLAIMPTVLVGGALGVFAYVTGNVNFAEYLDIPYVAGTGEVLVFCSLRLSTNSASIPLRFRYRATDMPVTPRPNTRLSAFDVAAFNFFTALIGFSDSPGQPARE